MSHFTVLVITSEAPTDKLLEETLMPFHQYECTGYERYLQDVDVTEKVLEQFNAAVQVVILADGTPHSRWDSKFYTKPPKEKWDTAKFELPVGAEEKEIDADDARKYDLAPQTMLEAAKDYFGDSITEREGKFYRRTNPNYKWDWWTRGGRWKGMLLQKPAAQLFGWSKGRPGAFDNGVMRAGGVDSVQVKNLDLVGMQNDAVTKAAELYDRAALVLNGRTFETFEALQGRMGIDEAREAFRKQEGLRALREADIEGSFFKPEQFLVSREQYLEKARTGALQTFAVLKGGEWYQRGEMGWWGVVHDSKEEDIWGAEFKKLLEALSPETWVTVVDCHI